MKKSIRFEAIGGQGANSAGKILAEAAVVGMGFQGNHFSSFGSEKRGSPIRSSVRYRDDGVPVRSASPISRPDILVVFHESLIARSLSASEGSQGGMIVIVNSALRPEAIRFPDGFRALLVCTVDALKISKASGCGLNAVMLGALGRFCPEISKDALTSAFRSFFSHLKEEALDANLDGLETGMRKAKTSSFSHGQAQLELKEIPLPKLGYENSIVGGAISNPGNTILRDMSHSRKGTLPLLDYERCIHCGYCDMVCPDYCFVWELARTEETEITLPSGRHTVHEVQTGVPVLQGIDYRYCKGCQKCVQACPVGALSVARDNERNRTYSGATRFKAIATETAYPLYSENEDTDESDR